MEASKRTLIWLAIMAVAVALFSGCKCIEYIPVETVRTDTVIQKQVERDSIHVHDSIKIREKGDSVIIEHWHTQFVDRFRTDTVYRSKRDSIAVPYPVEKKLTRWQQVCIDYGKLTLGATILLVIFVIIWLARKLKKAI